MNALDLPDVLVNLAGMTAITLLVVVLMWPRAERFLGLVCLVVAAIVLLLVLENHRL